jgi:predicted lysophospholipase L1 biosynthesis ABC-type transport system permease subunit
VLDALSNTPGIQSAAAADVLPIRGAVGNRGFLEGVRSYTWRVSEAFFTTMGMRMVAGRGFTTAEVATEAPTGVLSELGLEHLWPGVTPGDALGRVIHLDGRTPVQVVGVVGDVMGGSREPPWPSLYLPINREQFRALQFIVRVDPDAVVPLDDAQRRVAAVGNPGLLTTSAVDERVAVVIKDDRFRAALLGAFGLVGLVLACIGLYAVTSFDTNLRRPEMGVRLALGASAAGLRQHIVRGALQPVLIGTGAGVLIAWWAGKFLQAFLLNVDARDPWTLGVVVAVLIIAAAVAAWLPARRASQVDPATVLRTQ